MHARPVAAVVATVGGLALLFTFKTPSQQSVAAGGSTTTPPTRDPTSSAAPATDTPSTGLDTTAPADTAATSPPSSDAASTSTTAPGKQRSVKGPLITTRFGDVQVQLMMQGAQILDVKALTLPNDRQRSAEISYAAGPLLHDEVLQAQSAQIDLLSGATYTSEAYAESVQGALDAAAKA